MSAPSSSAPLGEHTPPAGHHPACFLGAEGNERGNNPDDPPHLTGGDQRWTWIAEVERERKRLERELRGKPSARKLKKAEIKALVRQLKDIVAVLANADPDDKRAIYDELGVNLTYHPDGRVRVGAGGRVLRVRVGGGT
jgi:hypothetical protein